MASDALLEMWGGLECTMARVGDRFRDQIAETGHRDRPDDLDLVAGLGIRTLRYPVLFESISPDDPEHAEWAWHDHRLGRIRDLGIRPIAGLVHHGSGPRYTDLFDPAFPDLVARHAERVARRYPWINLYTPINEPVTTARFSGLYGHWYPHRHDEASFVRALVNQCRAVVLSMRAIRGVNPRARLVQTDDLGRTFSTATLAYQADYDNGRRWLTFDLLFGRLDRHHPWWPMLRDHGVGEEELSAFLDREATPDIVGINHYLTSERFLDGRLARYPAHLHGGNGRDRYADAEAVRVRLPAEQVGPAARLREAWARYHAPVAITEVHHGCTRDEQLRWLMEVWEAAAKVRREGADIRAVTIWSMFGSVDWNSLLTRDDGIYEPGVFDARATPPRPTALAHAARALATKGAFDHPVLGDPGWWRRPDRFYRPSASACSAPAGRLASRPLLVVGPPGALSNTLSRIATVRGLACRRATTFDSPASAGTEIAQAWAVISVCDLEHLRADPVTGSRSDDEDVLAGACGQQGIPYLAFSTDFVFDGRLGRPYTESDAPSAIDVAGHAAAAREARLAALCPQALICRTGLLFGPDEFGGPIWRLVDDLGHGRRLSAPNANLFSPSYLPDLVHVALDLLIDGQTGLWHLANPGSVTFGDLAAGIAERAGLPPVPTMRAEALPASNRTLATQRGILMPPLASALDRFVCECGGEWRPTPVAAE